MQHCWMYCIHAFLKDLNSLLWLCDFGKNETFVVQEMLSFKTCFYQLQVAFKVYLAILYKVFITY